MDTLPQNALMLLNRSSPRDIFLNMLFITRHRLLHQNLVQINLLTLKSTFSFFSRMLSDLKERITWLALMPTKKTAFMTHADVAKNLISVECLQGLQDHLVFLFSFCCKELIIECCRKLKDVYQWEKI